MKIKIMAAWVASLLVLAGVGTVAKADVLTLYPSQTVTVPACLAAGGTSVVIPKGYYEVHVDVETAHVCYASTCATGGMRRRTGNHGATYLAVDTTVSCRSAADGAVVQFVPGGWWR